MRLLYFWVSATITSVLGLYWLFPTSSPIDLAEAALGKETQVVIGHYNGDRVHCFDMSDAAECLEPAKSRSLNKSALWLGNSQLHAINQPSPKSVPASVTAVELIREDGIELLTFSQPNANLAEHYILFEALTAKFDFNLLILPAVFDDMREQSIRPSIKNILAEADIAERLSKNKIGRDLLVLSVKEDKKKPVSLQDSSESIITSKLDSCCAWETLRSQARGKISLFLYQFRNYIFGIKPNSIRRMIKANYVRNLEAFDTILRRALKLDMKVIVYIPPLRSDVPIPYDPIEYAEFKTDIENISSEHGVNFANYEGIVPGPLWGMKDPTSLGGEKELDFMHFKEPGHALLAKSVAMSIIEALNDF